MQDYQKGTVSPPGAVLRQPEQEFGEISAAPQSPHRAAGGATAVESGIAAATGPSAMTQEAVTARVSRDATRIYGDTIAEETLAYWASSAVAELWGESVKVTTFLPVLALRMVGTQVKSQSEMVTSAAAD